MSDEFIKALKGLTDRVIAVRVLRERGLVTMPLEIKGLKSSMLKVAQRIENIKSKAVVFDQIGGNLEQGLDDITAQAKSHFEDLTFAATILGNSTSQSDQQQKTDEKKETIQITAGEVGKIDPLVSIKPIDASTTQHPPGLTAGGFKG